MLALKQESSHSQNGSTSLSPISHDLLANAIKVLAMDAVEKAQSGHPGMPMGMADVATVLFQNFLKFDAQHPSWSDRDRFVLSAGHGSMLLYALLYLTGYEDMTLGEIKNFRQLGSRTAGHPEYGHAAGIETTTGPLGQGLGNAVGMALAERMMAARFGDHLVDHYTYVIASDGDLMEGISHESISLAGHLKLNKLIVLFDDNHISIDGPTSLAFSGDTLVRFKAAEWDVQAIDGHDPKAIFQAIETARQSDRPSFIACRTTIAHGAPTKAGTAASHGSPLGAQEIQETRKVLGWTEEPFVIPENILQCWRQIGIKNRKTYDHWTSYLASLDHDIRNDFNRRLQGDLPDHWENPLEGLIQTLIKEQPKQATRQLSQRVLDVLAEVIPDLVGGSADLTGSNNTKAKSQTVVSADTYAGSYIHYGVREHGMAAAMNGLSLHGGIIPYGGTFLIFSDYCRPAIRLAALMEKRVIFVLTHDSIGLGEDGPTHQPIEHLVALRAIPNLNVFRPADGVEVAECWSLALQSKTTPSVIALTRQSVPHLRTQGEENLSAKGGYVLAESSGKRQVTLMATGSEVSIAIEAQKVLESHSICTAVVSLPCWRLFDQQSQEYRDLVLQPHTLRIAIEAASPMGWERYIGSDGIMIGMTTFGASGRYEDLYKHFGITAEHIVQAVKGKLGT